MSAAQAPLSLWPWRLQHNPLSIPVIVGIEAARLGVEQGDLIGRRPANVAARQAVMIAAFDAGHNYRAIARFFGLKDHTGAYYAIQPQVRA